MENGTQFAVIYRPQGTGLMRQACPSPEDVPFFNRCMSAAREMGFEWERALHFVIQQREAAERGGSPYTAERTM